MFLPSFLSSKPVQITPEIAEWNRKKLSKLYRRKKAQYYSKDSVFNFQSCREQMLTLLDFVIKETKNQYPLFSLYRNQIEQLKKDSPMPDVAAGLNWAKKALEQNLWFVSTKSIRPELLNDYEVSKCAAGAASNLETALGHFSMTGLDAGLHAVKKNVLLSLVQAFVSQYDLAPTLGSEVHYVYAYFNHLTQYGCDTQEDVFLPPDTALFKLEELSSYVEKHFTLSLFIEHMHFLLPSLPRERFDASNEKLYGQIEEYARFFGPTEAEKWSPRITELYHYEEEEALVNGEQTFQAIMNPKKEFNPVLDALLVEQLCRSKVIKPVILLYKEASYLFNGTSLLKILPDTYSLLGVEEQQALQDQITAYVLEKINNLDAGSFKKEELLQTMDKEHLVDLYKETYQKENLSILHKKCFSQIMQQESVYALFFQEIFKNAMYFNKAHKLLFAETMLSQPTHLTEEALAELAAYLGEESPNKVRQCILSANRKKAIPAVKMMLTVCPHLFNVNEPVDAVENTLAISMVSAKETEMVKILLEREINVNYANLVGNTMLLFAADHGDVEVVQALLEKGADVNKVNQDEASALLLASQKGHWEVVYALLEGGANVNQATKQEGITPLSYASQNGHLEAVVALLAYGADVNQGDLKGNMPLNRAVGNQHKEIVNVLLGSGANANHPGKGGWPPLVYAASRGDMDIVNDLLYYGADVNQQNYASQEETALYRAAFNGHTEVIDTLLRKGAAIDKGSNRFTPLCVACEMNHVDAAKTLLKYGANLCPDPLTGVTPLMLAAQNGHEEIVKLLLKYPLDINAVDNEGFTALFYAAAYGNLSIVQMLLDKGAAVNGVCKLAPPLCLAAQEGYIQIADLLLQEGANVDAVDDEGYSPLARAAANGYLKMVEMLLEKGASVNQLSGQFHPLVLAINYGASDIVDLLLQKGANVDEVNQDGFSVLTIAAAQGNLAIVQMLLKKGAVVNRPSDQTTPLILAARYGHNDIVDFLLKEGASVDERNDNGDAALIFASFYGHVKIVQALLEKGASVNQRGENGRPLEMAAREGHIEVVELLLERGTNVDPAFDYGSALYDAVSAGHLEVVKLLLNKGANVYQSSMLSKSLFRAAQDGDEDMVKELLLAGADTLPFKSNLKSLYNFTSNYSSDVRTRLIDWLCVQTEKGKCEPAKGLNQTVDMRPDEIAMIMGYTEIASLIQDFRLTPVPSMNIHTMFYPNKDTSDNDCVNRVTSLP